MKDLEVVCRGRGVPHHAQGARHRLPHGPPPPLAAVRAAARRSCGCGTTIIKAVRDFFDGNGFTLVDAPIFTPHACEGPAPLRPSPTSTWATAYLTQSGQLYMEAAAAAFGKVYCFGPTFRAEKTKTRRHLAEFWMVEPEVAFMNLEEDMVLAEDLSRFIVGTRAREARAASWSPSSSATSTKLENVKAPFPRITLRRGDRATCKAAGHPDAKFGDDFGGDEETVISQPVRPARHRPPLPGRAEGVLLQARPDRPDARARHGRARARGLRRDHRRRPARGRPRHAARSAIAEHQPARARPSSGTSTCAATARSPTPASASASSARSPGSAASPTSARPSPSPG